MATGTEGGEVDAAMMAAETKRLQAEIVKSTKQTLRELNEAERTGCDTLAALARQNEQIDGMARELDTIRNETAKADIILRKIASPFAFMFQKAKAKEFETRFGSPADWSGPLEMKRSFLPMFRQRFFVLHQGSLMLYKSSQGNVCIEDIAEPLQVMVLSEKTVLEPRRKTLEIVIRSRKDKWHVRCADERDFAGWHTMLERHSKGTFSTKTESEKAEREWVQNLASWLSPEEFTPGPQEAGESENVDQVIDQNLDLILVKLDNLGGIALEQRQAIELQNQKLDVLNESMEAGMEDINKLKSKHRRRLRDD